MVWWVWIYGVGSHEAMVLENVLGSVLLLVLWIIFGFKKWFGGLGFMGLGLMRLWFRKCVGFNIVVGFTDHVWF